MLSSNGSPLIMEPSTLPLLAAVLGACVGSFLQVVAFRLPRQESLIHPGSHCPHCGTPLAWFENVPVLGWLWLGGRCRTCRRSISPRYLLVELLCAGLWVAMVFAQPAGLGPAPAAWMLVAAGWLLVSWLIPLVLVDLDALWLPEPLCRWGLLLGLACTAVIGFSQGEEVGRALLFQHLLAAGIGLLGFEGTSALAERLLGRPALGLGDAKLAALLGAWLGPTGLGLAVALAIGGGAVVGGLARLLGRLGPQQPFPFGPFLACGGVLVWIGGHGLWLQLLGWPGP
ncbi:prepilin peptidase [Synechococcus sp. CCY9201]|jgi:leader peptidase (prepilin peptidase)/N-methyltransferase|uniref:prepilin peptidase n=1 Tax=unclassified Synechococcus TaxID=2626047 RepID=UPI001E5EDA91|nr:MULTISPECIES: A24 family peptidase [unclassified Synechococcus]MEA5473715.1 prepilin peptidase [Synechococcus sp. CCY9201]